MKLDSAENFVDDASKGSFMLKIAPETRIFFSLPRHFASVSKLAHTLPFFMAVAHDPRILLDLVHLEIETETPEIRVSKEIFEWN